MSNGYYSSQLESSGAAFRINRRYYPVTYCLPCYRVRCKLSTALPCCYSLLTTCIFNNKYSMLLNKDITKLKSLNYYKVLYHVKCFLLYNTEFFNAIDNDRVGIEKILKRASEILSILQNSSS